MTLDLPRRFPWPTLLSVGIHGAVVAGLLYTSVHQVMQQLGLPEMAIDIRHLLDGSLEAMVADTLGQLPALNARLADAVNREREQGFRMVQSVLTRIGEGK